MLRGQSKLHTHAVLSAYEMLEKFRIGAEQVNREYLLQKMAVENMRDISLDKRRELRDSIKQYRDAELAKFKELAHTTLTEMRLFVSRLGDDMPEPQVYGVDWRDYGKREIRRAQQIVNEMRGG